MATEIFRTNPSRLNKMTESPTESEDSEKGTDASRLTPKDFFWDQMVTIMVSAILGLTLLDIVAEFFRATGLQCYTPYNVEIPYANDFTRDRAAFVNSYCYRRLPRGEFFTIFLLAHGILIIAPHFIWSSVFGGNFDHFFGLVGELSRLRNLKTGQYDEKNFEIVRKLEKEYGQKVIYWSYIAKLVVQLLFSLTSFFLGVGYFGNDSFTSSFCCPNECEDSNSTIDTNLNLPNDWPKDLALESNLRCVYPSLQYLLVLRHLDVLLVSLAIVFLLFGIFWCILLHPTGLHHKDVADFVNKSCLTADDYVAKSWRHRLRKRKLWKLWSRSFWTSFLSPEICNDVQFLLMRVFRTDAGLGKVFEEIQIQRGINQLNKEMNELYQMFSLSADFSSRAKVRGKLDRSGDHHHC